MMFRGLRISARCTYITAILSMLVFAILSSNWGWYGYLKYSFLPCLYLILAAGAVFASFLVWSIVQSILEIRSGRSVANFPLDQVILAAVSVGSGIALAVMLK